MLDVHTMNTLCSANSSSSSLTVSSSPSSSSTTLVFTFEVTRSMAESTLSAAASLVSTSPMLEARSDRISWRILSSRLVVDVRDKHSLHPESLTSPLCSTVEEVGRQDDLADRPKWIQSIQSVKATDYVIYDPVGCMGWRAEV